MTGKNVDKELEEIFAKAGEPVAIIKDNGSALNSGVEIYKEQHSANIKTVEDITHIVANGLKKQFEKTKQYQEYMKMLRDGATKLRQTDLAFLIPPKLRKKGRFQAISDIIESLFGKFKYSLKRSAQSDMNRATLLIPLLCGNLDKQKILNTLAQYKA